jgi:hypothetical protein
VKFATKHILIFLVSLLLLLLLVIAVVVNPPLHSLQSTLPLLLSSLSLTSLPQFLQENV